MIGIGSIAESAAESRWMVRTGAVRCCYVTHELLVESVRDRNISKLRR